jgi:branched-subunit amino acid aminotransferase/4-amino-4-deoxychorismate lyase
MNIPIYRPADLAGDLERLRQPWHKNYLAMFSSVIGGIVTDPVLMTVPVDDHLVHRADAVFDALKCVNGNAYCFREHMARLERSALGIDLKMPPEYDHIEDYVRATMQAGGERDTMVRIIVSRGSGSFSTNPYDCPRSHMYIVITNLKTPPDEEYEKGVAIISAPVPVKPPIFANIKSCDYLGNVLIKKAAVEAGVKYAVNWDELGYLAEGSTENIILVSEENELLLPEYARVLKGVTLSRTVALAEKLVQEGMLKAVRNTGIDREIASRAREAMLTGTSLDVLPVTLWDNNKVGDGNVGPVAKRLLELMREDVRSNTDVLTPML